RFVIVERRLLERRDLLERGDLAERRDLLEKGRFGSELSNVGLPRRDDLGSGYFGKPRCFCTSHRLLLRITPRVLIDAARSNSSPLRAQGTRGRMCAAPRNC